MSIIQGGPELEVLFLVMSPSAIGDLISIHKVEIEISGGWQKVVSGQEEAPDLQVNCVQSKTLAHTLN